MSVMLMHIYIESRKTVLMSLFAGKEWRHRGGEWTCGHSGGGREWDEWRRQPQHIYTLLCTTDGWGEVAI